VSAHTPGPWRLDLDEKLGDWQVIDTTGTRVVADRPSNYEANNGPANARLIAAAPDLLAACEALLNCTSTNAKPCGDCARLARAAIEKARGK